MIYILYGWRAGVNVSTSMAKTSKNAVAMQEFTIKANLVIKRSYGVSVMAKVPIIQIRYFFFDMLSSIKLTSHEICRVVNQR